MQPPCAGQPECDTPWALVVFGDLGSFSGLPASAFAEEAPGKHVWRNRAGASLQL